MLPRMAIRDWSSLYPEYDILLLDWMLPGISGIEICRKFRKVDSKTPRIL
jgi:DNA-binding response OmpR family regulator